MSEIIKHIGYGRFQELETRETKKVHPTGDVICICPYLFDREQVLGLTYEEGGVREVRKVVGVGKLFYDRGSLYVSGVKNIS